MGWLDNTSFAYCAAEGPGMQELGCYSIDVKGARTPIDPERVPRAKAPLAPSPTDWKFGAALRFRWQIDKASFVDTGPPHQGPVLRLEGTNQAQIQASTVGRIAPAPHDPNLHLHLDAVAPSPQGTALAVLIHSYSGEWSDKHSVHIWPLDELAARAFNGLGLIEHRKQNFKEAARLFHLAAHTGSRSPLAMYNLACALARMGSVATEPALREAIVRGGPDVGKKARKDRDFDSVEDEPWFEKL